MKKRLLSLLLALTMPMSAMAADMSEETTDYTQITVPSGCELFVGENPRGEWSYNYFVPFIEYSPVSSQDNGDGTTTYSYHLAQNNDNNIFNYRITSDDYITYAGTFVNTEDFSMTVTEAELETEEKTKTSLDRDISSNNGFNTADIYLNINPKGHLIMEPGDTYQLMPLRRWEIIDTTENNYIIEPDYHYGVTGTSVTVDENGLITAAENGTSIVTVTYDAINVNNFVGGPFFGAIHPENTGVFVVTVGGEESTESLGIDSELDVVYFTGEEGSYTVSTNSTVSVSNPVAGRAFEEVDPNGDGTVTIPLTEGRNVVRLGDDYQVITAKKVSYTINSGEQVHPGDELRIVFDTVFHPVGKLAGVYNSSASILYTTPDGSTAGSNPGTYTFASDADCQTISNLITRTEGEEWGSTTVAYSLGESLTVPSDWNKDTYTLTGGKIVAYGYGDPFGNHRGITFEGKAPNDNYNMMEGFFGVLPDIEIPITATTSPISSIALDTTNVQTSYYPGDAFNTDNLIVTASYEDGTTQIATNYTVSPEVIAEDTTEVTVTYRGMTATIPITVIPVEVISIAVTTLPLNTTYTAGETFNPTGMVVTATYNNGTTMPTTEYSYAPNSELSASHTEMTVTYTGADGIAPVTVPITVTDGGGQSPGTASVYFTLMGDNKHGASGGIHTLKDGNLTTWISKRQISVNPGSFVIDVLTKALSLSGIPYSNPTGNYIESIRGLGELDNGSTSGWMYTLNGNHPTKGIDAQTVRNGDTIVFHYTDDYTVERSADSWTGSTGSSSSPKPKPVVIPEAKDPEPEVEKPLLSDVEPSHWYYEAVKYVYENGLMTGTGEGFEPDTPMTRAMLVTVLFRNEGEPNTYMVSPFSDIDTDAYYAAAVAWAAEKGIVTGTGEALFSPHDIITREQMAVMLFRYAQYKNLDTSVGENTNILSYYDFNEISEYAISALQWTAGSGIMKGETESTLNPKNNSTRAQVATILMRFCDKERN